MKRLSTATTIRTEKYFHRYFLGGEIIASATTNTILSFGQNYGDYKFWVEFGTFVKYMGIGLSCVSFPVMVFGVVKYDAKMKKNEFVNKISICPKCNMELRETSKFCYKCGAKVK